MCRCRSVVTIYRFFYHFLLLRITSGFNVIERNGLVCVILNDNKFCATRKSQCVRFEANILQFRFVFIFLLLFVRTYFDGITTEATNKQKKKEKMKGFLAFLVRYIVKQHINAKKKKWNETKEFIVSSLSCDGKQVKAKEKKRKKLLTKVEEKTCYFIRCLWLLCLFLLLSHASHSNAQRRG